MSVYHYAVIVEFVTLAIALSLVLYRRKVTGRWFEYESYSPARIRLNKAVGWSWGVFFSVCVTNTAALIVWAAMGHVTFIID